MHRPTAMASSYRIPPPSAAEPVTVKAELVRPHPDPLAEQIVYYMDNAIPLPGGFSIGMDAIIGLVPGIGDVLGGLVSGFIVLRAAQAGVPRAALTRMVGNICIDTLGGSLPIVGDVFDVAFKSNQKNLQIYRESLEGTRNPVHDQLFVAGLVVAILVAIAIPLLLFWALWQIVSQMHL